MRRTCVLAVLTTACFSDAPPVDDGGGTTAAECPLGANTCPCTSGGTCDAGLECHAQLQLCYDPGCTPGAERCTCREDGCDEGLRCNEGLCEPESTPTTTDASTTAASTTGADSTGPGTTTLLEEGEVDVDTGTPSECGACLEAQFASCPKVGSMCMESETCQEIAACIFDGGDAGLCCNMIIDMAWNDFASCALGMCLEQCADVMLYC